MVMFVVFSDILSIMLATSVGATVRLREIETETSNILGVKTTSS